MPSTGLALTPGLASFLKSLKTNPIDTSIENLISCALTPFLLWATCPGQTFPSNHNHLRIDCSNAAKSAIPGHALPQRQRWPAPHSCSAAGDGGGNIVRRVLGLIRDEAEDDHEAEFSLNASLPLDRDALGLRQDGQDRNAVRPPLTSMFSLLSHPEPENSQPSTPGSQSPSGRFPSHGPSKDVRAEVLEGINEIIDELGQVDEQIAAYALDHIHSNEIILTHTSSSTVQKFLLKAAAKRKFTVIHAESFPNNHDSTHATVSGKSLGDDDQLSTDAFQKPLIQLGITVILIPDSAVFALMSRVNKVILGTHSVLANGGLVAAAGTRVIARAAKVHQTPVVVVSGVYKLSPVYPFDFESLIEYGDASKVLPYEDGDLVEKIDVQNPIYDYVPAELVDLYITNLGGHAPSYLYRIVSDHYRKEDISF
ncbi:hypothetical protein N7468_000192 [Penicillium chermesinum]|uniref:Translation initiation factor eIF2B subunit beta n=1 Tax=Penicillium chermesinum TaxID=63820 RepID=A0A9W9PJW1_9EURO|nr:uncharacterized protein N7468_000192 [Penicillium chermesinum]KAJ5248741.1 hypothetical protein N7468_000192 [Penicillium chermesinum]